jgi:glycosyltransferase involved in cell wall biosynthesis
VSNPRIYIAISTFLPLIGGAEMQALAQGRSLHERGYDATIITFRHERSWQSREVIEGVPVIRVAGTMLGGREKLPRLLQKLLYLVALLTMSWTLWRQRRHYDILHVYQFSSLALLAALVSRLTGKPIIIAIRSAGSGKTIKSSNEVSLVAGPLDITLPWLKVDGRTWVESDLEGLERMGKLFVRFTRSLLYRTDAVLVVLSSRMKGYLAAHDFHLPHTQLIPNGVDASRFSPTIDTSIDERAQVVMCVSKLRYEKGIDVLLQAWRLVHEQVPQAHLIIVGNGPLQFQLECMVQTLGIAGSVEFAGLQSDIPAQLHRGKLAVLPSRWEGMPNALLEAMACGSACVATRVSGSEDIIEHGVNGLLVEPGDYEGMAQALLTLLRDPALAQKYGQAARATIEKHYSFEHIMDRYIELYQRIMDGRLKGDTSLSEICHLPS